jgi:hypothetical protein
MLGTPPIIVNTANAPANQPRSQANYDRQMKDCEAGWRATGDPWVFAEALTLALVHREVIPAWLADAGWSLADERRGKEHAKRELEARIRFMRYKVVRDAHELDGLSWEKAREHAVKVLVNTEAVGSSETMWDAYKQVNKDLKEGRSGLYFTPKRQHR